MIGILAQMEALTAARMLFASADPDVALAHELWEAGVDLENALRLNGPIVRTRAFIRQRATARGAR